MYLSTVTIAILLVMLLIRVWLGLSYRLDTRISQLDQNVNDSGNTTQADQNTQLNHNLGGSTASISTGQGTKGRSDVQTVDPGCELLKEDVGNVPVWVNFHNVPIIACSKDRLSAITTKLADVELKDTIVVDVPKLIDVLKNPRHAFRGVQVGPKVRFRPNKQVYQPVAKKNGANTS
ncbi:hypothetical protein Tco_1258901, partial [Tanacetum coccineum]